MVVVIIIVIVAVAVVFLMAPSTTTTPTTTPSTTTTSTPTSTLTTSTTTSTTPTTSQTTPSTITITFGATLSMTGPLQAFGQEENWTFNYAINYVNSLGGIPLANGTHAMIKLVVLDDQSNPSIGVTNLNELVSTYHSSIILGELGGVQDSVAQSFATKTQIPYIGPVYISTYKT
ncbi:MAG: ABC transporter substrate-binding protein, partial [Nitrososphaerota archaeon]|nr:ABC transporter substrate-binding protein [Nitrososphaerota archaeon]